MKDLVEIFNAENGIVSFVGAGGKKTAMFQLANAHSGRVGITATAHIEYFPNSLNATKYIGEEQILLDAIANDTDSKTIAFAKPSERFGRRAGVSCESLKEFKQLGNFDLIVVKSDGARGRFIKAPAEHEPIIPQIANVVVPVISAKVLGMPLNDKITHRVQKMTELTGLNENEIFQPEHITKLLISNEGSLKNSDSKKVIPLINMVDYTELQQLAAKAATEALAQTDRFDKVVLASMREQDPIVDIIAR